MIKLEHYNNDLGLLHNALIYFDQISAFEYLKCKNNVELGRDPPADQEPADEHFKFFDWYWEPGVGSMIPASKEKDSKLKDA